MNGYICLWKGKRVEVYAETTYQAQTKAVEEFKKVAGRKKVKAYEVSVHLAEREGSTITHRAVD